MLVRFPASPVLGILGCGVMASTACRALTQGVDVVVLVDPPFVARYGDTVNVTALIFDRGVASDPSAISESSDKHPRIDPLTLHQDSLRVYNGTFDFRNHPSVVKVNASVAGVQDSGSAVVLEKSLSVAVLPSKMIATAGERISVGVEVRDNHNALTDVRWLNLTAQIGYAPFEAWSASENISSTRTAVGQYSAYYTVPPNISRDAIVAFQASAVNPGGGSTAGFFGLPVRIECPDPFLIWYRTVAIGASKVTVEIDVAFNGAEPLANLTVSVRPGGESHHGQQRPVRSSLLRPARFRQDRHLRKHFRYLDGLPRLHLPDESLRTDGVQRGRLAVHDFRGLSAGRGRLDRGRDRCGSHGIQRPLDCRGSVRTPSHRRWIGILTLRPGRHAAALPPRGPGGLPIDCGLLTRRRRCNVQHDDHRRHAGLSRDVGSPPDRLGHPPS